MASKNGGDPEGLKKYLETRAASSIESGGAKPDAIERGATKVSAATGANRGTFFGAST